MNPMSWRPSAGDTDPVSKVVYSPRFPHVWDAWTPFQCMPLWARIEACRTGATLALLRGPRPPNVARAVRREAIRIAGLPQNRQPYPSWGERWALQRSVERWMARHAGRLRTAGIEANVRERNRKAA